VRLRALFIMRKISLISNQEFYDYVMYRGLFPTEIKRFENCFGAVVSIPPDKNGIASFHFTSLDAEKRLVWLFHEDMNTDIDWGWFKEERKNKLAQMLFAYLQPEQGCVDMYRIGLVAENFPDALETWEAFKLAGILERMIHVRYQNKLDDLLEIQSKILTALQ
jgi:hypothetical protein